MSLVHQFEKNFINYLSNFNNLIYLRADTEILLLQYIYIYIIIYIKYNI